MGGEGGVSFGTPMDSPSDVPVSIVHLAFGRPNLDDFGIVSGGVVNPRRAKRNKEVSVLKAVA